MMGAMRNFQRRTEISASGVFHALTDHLAADAGASTSTRRDSPGMRQNQLSL